MLFQSICITNIEVFTTDLFYVFVLLPHLHDVKYFKVNLVQWSSNPSGVFSASAEARMYRLFNERLRTCLQYMPNLISFSYVPLPLHHSVPPLSVLQSQGTADTTSDMDANRDLH